MFLIIIIFFIKLFAEQINNKIFKLKALISIGDLQYNERICEVRNEFNKEIDNLNKK